MTASAGRGKPPLRPSEGPAFPPATVLEALARIIASEAFRASARRKRLLSFLVEQTVAGRADRLKPYAIAVDALGLRRDLQSTDRPARPSGGRSAAAGPRALLPDRWPRRPLADHHPQGWLRAGLRAPGSPARGDAPGHDAFTARPATLACARCGAADAHARARRRFRVSRPERRRSGPPVGARGGARSAGDAARGRRRRGQPTAGERPHQRADRHPDALRRDPGLRRCAARPGKHGAAAGRGRGPRLCRRRQRAPGAEPAPSHGAPDGPGLEAGALEPEL